MKTFNSVLVLAIAAFLVTGANAVSLPIHRGWPLSRARAALLKSGWRPVVSTGTFEDGTRINRVELPGEFYRAGYIEVEDCSQGPAYCLFRYKNHGNCLNITTLGERKDPPVVGWEFRCL